MDRADSSPVLFTLNTVKFSRRFPLIEYTLIRAEDSVDFSIRENLRAF
ncbi:hypothetical protein [Pollutibacter soli]